MYQLLFYYKWHYRYLKLMYRQMTYYQDLELNNPHRKYIILLMSKIVLLVFLHG